MFNPRKEGLSESKTGNKFKFDYNDEKKTLNNVPIWMLFIDKDCHSHGEMFFDEKSKYGKAEPGYNAAMTSAFKYMLNNINKKLDEKEFQEIHHLCVGTVQNVNSNKMDFDPGVYGINLENVTDAARAEWISEKLIITWADRNKVSEVGFLSFFNHHSNIMESFHLHPDANGIEAIIDKVNSLFKNYYSKIDRAKNDQDKLLAIVSLCRELEIGHFFRDGNQRTIVFVLLNKLLIENGLPPTILQDPIVFDGYLSRDELAEAVTKGQRYFLECAEKHGKSYSSSEREEVKAGGAAGEPAFFENTLQGKREPGTKAVAKLQGGEKDQLEPIPDQHSKIASSNKPS